MQTFDLQHSTFQLQQQTCPERARDGQVVETGPLPGHEPADIRRVVIDTASDSAGARIKLFLNCRYVAFLVYGDLMHNNELNHLTDMSEPRILLAFAAPQAAQRLRNRPNFHEIPESCCATRL